MPDPGVLYCDGFEYQTINTQTFGGAGTTFGTVTNASVETTIVKNGAASLHLAPTVGTAGRVLRAVPASNRIIVQSFYVYITSLPASDLIVAVGTGPTPLPTLVYKQSTNTFGMRYAAGTSTAFGPTLSNATWYLIDWIYDVSTTTFSQTAKVDGGTEVNITSAGTAADVASVGLGTSATGGPAADMYFDDWVAGVASYPLGTHAVKMLKPTGDGSHNQGSVIENAAGADITTGVYAFLDEVPAENTDYVQQSASGSGNYAEVTFDDPVDATVWGVMATGACEGAAAGSSGMIFRIVDAGGTTILDQGTATTTINGTTRRHSHAMVPFILGHTAWSTEPSGDLSALKGRVGFATDVTPVPRALMFILQYATPSDGLGGGGGGTSDSLGDLLI